MNIPAITTDQMREVDRLMIERYRISLIQMMENAGRGLAELSCRILDENLAGKRITVLCGAGNNGGGGMAAARHLHNRGAEIQVKLAAEPSRLKEVPAKQWIVLKAMGVKELDELPGEEADLVIDALLGYGLSSNPRPPISELISWMNTQPARVLSLDTPSGLDTTSGAAYMPTVHATATMTLALPKTGLVAPEARKFVGKLFLADISVPPELYQDAFGLVVPDLFNEDSVIKVQ